DRVAAEIIPDAGVDTGSARPSAPPAVPPDQRDHGAGAQVDHREQTSAIPGIDANPTDPRAAAVRPPDPARARDRKLAGDAAPYGLADEGLRRTGIELRAEALAVGKIDRP